MAILSPEFLLILAGFIVLVCYAIILFMYFRFNSIMTFSFHARFDSALRDLLSEIQISSRRHRESDISKLLEKDHT